MRSISAFSAATSVITVAGLAVPGAKPLSVLYSGTRTGIKMATGDEATRMSTSAKVVAKQSVQGGPSVVGVSASSILAVSLIVYDGVGVAQGLMTAFSPK